MNNDTTTPKPSLPKQPAIKGLDGAACSVFIVEDSNFEGVVGSCSDCGGGVASYLCNDSVILIVPEAEEWDYWIACTNPSCRHHRGEGYLMDRPAWFIPNVKRTCADD
jgi:hypothetical protein